MGTTQDDDEAAHLCADNISTNNLWAAEDAIIETADFLQRSSSTVGKLNSREDCCDVRCLYFNAHSLLNKLTEFIHSKWVAVK